MFDVLIDSAHQFPIYEQDLVRIHVIGDSHALVFGKSKLFSVHHIGPATAYNLKNENSSTNSNQKLFGIIEKINEFKDIVILVFGEIDCRIHIYYKYMMSNKTTPISELIDKTVSNYGMVLKQLREININFLVCGIPAAGFEENIYKYPFYASPEIRTKIFYEFNERLKNFCGKNNYKYINIYPIVSDKNGFLLQEYADDNVHLNEKIIPFIEDWLRKEYKGRINSNSVGESSLNEVDGVDTFEIRDKEIDVEEIKRKIRENIKLRKESGAYPDDEIKELNSNMDKVDQGNSGPSALVKEIQHEIEYINSNWDIQNTSYSISSNRPLAGKALVKGRELVHDEVRRYVDPVIWKQREFNRSVVGLLNKLPSEIAENVRINIATIGEDIENKAWLANILENKSHATKTNRTEESGESIDYINYFIFSDEMSKIWTKLSGKSVDTPNIFIDSIELFKDCKNVLDIGCGSGYFLKIMKQNGIGAYGIDLNEDLVAYCQKIGFNATKIDALSHLQSIDNKSLDGIFMNQLAEHLSIDNLFKLLKLSYEKLQYGSYVIITIPNILSMLVSANLFYLDPTHQRQLHPEVIKFLLKSCGFRDIQEKYYQPIPDEIKLEKIEIKDYPQEVTIKKIMEIYNNNIAKLNNILFGFRDCTVLCKK